MDRFVAFVLSNFSTIVILSSLAWLILRAYQVLSQPSEELINLLGIEVPTAPALSLHGIKADGVILNWKAPELQKSSAIKYYLYINGVNVNELTPLETSIAVTGLRPDTNYIIRVVAVNSLNFESKSEPTHVQTRGASTQDFFQRRDSREESSENEAVEQDASPAVRPYKLVGDVSVAAPAMHREHSGSITQQRKNTGTRRVSAAAQQGYQNGVMQESDEGESAVRELTAKLDKLNVEIDATKEDLVKEDEEFQNQQSLLATSKSDLKQAVTDKEGASKALKKQVADLSGQNSTAQGKRATAEKRLQSKHQDHQKLRDDIKKWDKEIAAFRAEAERLDQEKIIYCREADGQIAQLREEVNREAEANKIMEDQLKQARNEIRELEHEMDRLGQEVTDDVQGPHAFSQSRDTDWPVRLRGLQMNYHAAFSKLEEARLYAQQAQLSMDEWEQRRAAQPQMFLSPPIVDMQVAPGRRNSNRRSRTMSLRNELNPPHGFDLSAPPPYSSTMATISPAFASVSPFFNMMNGAPMAHDHMASMSPPEIEQPTAGAPTSPSVFGALLPSGLLYDDEPSKLPPLDTGSSKSSPMAANALPGLGAPQTLEHGYRDPASPTSNTSRSPSVFQSPRESSTHLPFAFANESMFDTDRRSIRSNTSSFRNLGPTANSTTRFASLFGFNRQRGKTSSDEGPALGSLKSAESQSFPRQDLSDVTGTGSRRRGSHSGGTWRDQLQNPFSRNSTNKELPNEAQPARRRFGFLPPKSGEAPESPRPGSTASSENTHLPKPSADSSSRFGWGMPSDPFGQRNSPLGTEWGLATNSWSRHASRRPSITYGSGHSFMDESYLDQDPDLAPRRRSPKLAPIGTRPTSQISTGSKELPRLNPAAPTFKTLFTRGDKRNERSERGEKSEKGKSKKESPKDKGKQGVDCYDFLDPNLASNPASSHSTEFSPIDYHPRGAPSISTADTASEPRESLELTTSRASEATPKETFMQKLSRKSSASMFNFPSFGGSKEKGARFSKRVASPSGGCTPDETDEEGPANGSSTKLSSSYVSEGKGGGLSPMIGGPSSSSGGKEKEKEKFSFRRSLTVGRRKDKDASASSLHESVTSEAGDDDVEEHDAAATAALAAV